MKTELSRLYILMISAGYDKKMFEDIILSFKRNDHKKMLKDFENLSIALKKMKHTDPDITRENNISSRNINDKIYKMLIVDSGLSISECITLLNENIKKMYPNRKFPKINSKKGFYASMNSLARIFTDSELLHIASKLKNKLGPSEFNDDDWTLKE